MKLNKKIIKIFENMNFEIDNNEEISLLKHDINKSDSETIKMIWNKSLRSEFDNYINEINFLMGTDNLRYLKIPSIKAIIVKALLELQDRLETIYITCVDYINTHELERFMDVCDQLHNTYGLNAVDYYSCINKDNVQSFYKALIGGTNAFSINCDKCMAVYEHTGIKYNVINLDNKNIFDKISLRKICERCTNWNRTANLEWLDTSNVTDMSSLFKDSIFNGDISSWDTCNVINMAEMFQNSKFNGDISNWNVKNVKYINRMFQNSNFNGDISDWQFENLQEADTPFINCDIKDIYKPKYEIKYDETE